MPKIIHVLLSFKGLCFWIFIKLGIFGSTTLDILYTVLHDGLCLLYFQAHSKAIAFFGVWMSLRWDKVEFFSLIIHLNRYCQGVLDVVLAFLQRSIPRCIGLNIRGNSYQFFIDYFMRKFHFLCLLRYWIELYFSLFLNNLLSYYWLWEVNILLYNTLFFL